MTSIYDERDEVERIRRGADTWAPRPADPPSPYDGVAVRRTPTSSPYAVWTSTSSPYAAWTPTSVGPLLDEPARGGPATLPLRSRESRAEPSRTGGATSRGRTAPASGQLGQDEPARDGWIVVGVAVFTQMLIWLDLSIVNLVLPVLADPVDGLAASASALEWVASGYTMVFAALLLAGGASCDRLGPRTALLIGLGILTATSTCAAFAGSTGILIASRSGMGIGSALLMPSTLALIVQGTSPRIRGRAIALWTSSNGLGVALGPVVGGLLLTRFWWGSVFLINVPVALLCVVAVLALVPVLRVARPRPLDIHGLILSFTGLLALVYGAISAGQALSLTQPDVMISLVAGVVIIYAYVLHQTLARHPSFDVRLLLLPQVGLGGVGTMIAFFTLSGSLFCTTLYLQGVKELTPLSAGLAMLPAAAGVILGGQIAPTLVALFRPRSVIVGGMAGNAAALALMTRFDEQTAIWWFAVVMFVQAAAFGLVGPPSNSAMLEAVPGERAGMASAMIGMLRQIGSAFGVAILGSLLNVVYRYSVTASLAGRPGAVDSRVSASASEGLSAAADPRTAGLRQVVFDAFLDGMGVSVGLAAVLALIGAFAFAQAYRRPTRARHRATRSGVTS